jgi:DNA (cytosine-5)-methyltransferase 1
VDLVVGGPPCQDYSVAGQRASLSGARGDLTLQYAHILDAIDPAWSVTENVPGWLSTADNAFGAFLGILVGADAALVPGRGQRWTDAGVVAGPKRTAAWRILDAQYFGVPQRRRRVFVVACRGAGNFACAEALFPLRTSLRRDTAPRRETREDIAAGAGDGTAAGFNNTGQGWWNGADIAAGLRDMSAGSGSKEATLIANPLGAKRDGGWRGDLDNDTLVAFQANAGRDFTADDDRSPPLRSNGIGGIGGVAIAQGIPDPAYAIAAGRQGSGSVFGSGRDAQDTFVVCGRGGDVAATLQAAVGGNGNGGNGNAGNGSEMIVAYGIRSDAARAGEALTPSPDAEGRVRLRDPGFNVYEDTAPTLDRTAHAVAFHQNVRSEVRITDVMGALNTGGGKPGQGYPAIAFDPTARQPEWSLNRPLKTDGPLALQSGMSVRRLTPRECERLQGFPDGWTDISHRGKPAADGPRYRAVGNSMAVPVIGWVLSRVQQIAAASLETAPSTGSGRAAA